MDDNFLTRLEHAGAQASLTNPTPAERNALWLHLGALRTAGHAVTADENHHADDVITISVLHYRTCRRCADAL